MIVRTCKSPSRWANATPHLEMEELLTPAERKEFSELIGVVRQGIESFVEAGKALTVIRDKRLYRERFNTFEAFCRAEFSMTTSYASRLIGGVKGIEELSDGVKPANERVVRELNLVPEFKRKVVWKHALSLSEKPTRSDVRAATHEIMKTKDDNVDKMRAAARLLAYEVDISHLSPTMLAEVLHIAASMVGILQRLLKRILVRRKK